MTTANHDMDEKKYVVCRHDEIFAIYYGADTLYHRDSYPQWTTHIEAATHYTLAEASDRLRRIMLKYDREFEIKIDESSR